MGENLIHFDRQLTFHIFFLQVQETSLLIRRFFSDNDSFLQVEYIIR